MTAAGGVDLYAVIFNVEESYIPEFRVWYTQRHVPDLLSSGFVSAHAFETVRGTPRFINIYEQNKDVFRNTAYAAARGKDAELSHAESMLRDLEKATYAQTLLGGDGAPPPFDADWITLLRFDLPEGRESALREWLVREEVPALLKGGALRCRLGIRNGTHPLFPKSIAPRVVFVVESSTEPKGTEALAQRLGARFAGEAQNVGITIAKRYFSGKGAAAAA